MKITITNLYKDFVGEYTDNEYIKKYDEIIDYYLKNRIIKKRGVPTTIPTERHHIIPKFWFKLHNKDIINGGNLIRLPIK